MGLHGAKEIELRFTRYVEELVSVIGHADRAGPFRDYCTGLVMPGERKSVEPMAAITAPGRTAAQERGTDGGDHGARANRGTASVVAAFCRPRSLVRRCCFDQGGPDGVAADDARRTDRGL